MMTTRAMIALMTLTVVGCSKQEAASETAPAENAANAPAEKAAEDDPHAAFENLPVEKVEQLLTAKEIVAVDANNPETRSEFGTLPGAVKLSNSRSFDVAELPEDKSTNLVFYCSSEQCRAAPKAASKAKAAGYSAVNVMRAGIRGWVSAGKPVEKS